MKECKVCGLNENDTKIIGDVCRKHYLQFWRYGTYLPRTKYDPNRFIVKEDVVEIELYDVGCKVIGHAVVDYDDLNKVKPFKWYMRKGYVCSTTKGKKCFLHRLVMDTPDDLFVDHINGNRLDNRKDNLRNCTKAENTRNRVNRKQVAGIQQAPSGSYTAVITVNYAVVYLGSFETYSDAVDARLEAEKQYFGDYRPKQII